MYCVPLFWVNKMKFVINVGSTQPQWISLPADQPTDEIFAYKLPILLLFQLAPTNMHP